MWGGFNIHNRPVATELYSVPGGDPGKVIEGLPGAAEAIVAARDGTLLRAPDGSEDAAAAIAVAISGLENAGKALGFSGLNLLSIRGAETSSVIAVRELGFLLSRTGAQQPVAPVEKALERWSVRDAAAPARDGWAALRDALVRGRLSDAIACWREIEAAPPLREALAGSEPLHREDLDRALEGLLNGIACAIAGDGLSGARWLRGLAVPEQRNLSVRWLAHFWSSRAALQNGDLPAAAAHSRQALALAPHLGPRARAVSCWAAAEVFALERDPRDARARLAEAHDAFSRSGDGWGVARAKLAEARILAALGRDAEADEAAGVAAAADSVWDEPDLFRARRALLRGDAAAAKQALGPLQGPGAHRERSLISAFERRAINPADLAELIQAREAPPSADAAVTLTRIAAAAPGCVAVQDALGWMLVRLGRYDEAKTAFTALLAQPLDPGERLSMLAGLGCLAATSRRPAEKPDRKERGAAAPTPSQPPNVALRGKLSEVPLPDVFEFLRVGRRSGVLICNSGRAGATLRFRGGFITDAWSANEPSRQQPGLEKKIEQLVREILRWKTGEFSFERDDAEVKADGADESSVDPQALLLKLFAESDEASRGG